MSKINGKYMVNLEGEERWGGEMFDTPEEAIREARRVILEKDMYADVFGEWLDNLIWRGEDKRHIFPEEFMLGRVRTPSIPLDLGFDLIERLDESYWEEDTFEDELISERAFSKEDIESLNKILVDFIKPRVDKSGYYIVEILEKVDVEVESE